MYYICKFSDSWSLYDSKKNISRPLDNLLRQVGYRKIAFSNEKATLTCAYTQKKKLKDAANYQGCKNLFQPKSHA